MPHTTTNLLVHFIFSTKQRCALIKPEFEKDLHAYLGGIVRQIGGTALCVNGTRDHVHLLVRVSANHSVADIARLIKTKARFVPWAGKTVRFGLEFRFGLRLTNPP